MQNHNKKDQMIEIISIIMGNFIIAAGVTFFILPLDILSGGVAGIAVALQPIFKCIWCGGRHDRACFRVGMRTAD